MVDKFIQAIHNCSKILISFYSKDDGRLITRRCAPLDYGPSRRAKNKVIRFHMLDFDSDKKRHILSVLPEQINQLEILQETFDPADIINWSTKTSKWFVPRDWGKYS